MYTFEDPEKPVHQNPVKTWRKRCIPRIPHPPLHPTSGADLFILPGAIFFCSGKKVSHIAELRAPLADGGAAGQQPASPPRRARATLYTEYSIQGVWKNNLFNYQNFRLKSKRKNNTHSKIIFPFKLFFHSNRPEVNKK